MKILEIFRSLYDQVYIVKPLTSRPSVSEKYVVCKGFKSIDKKTIDSLTELQTSINKSNLKIVDLFSSYDLNNDFKMRMIQINRELTNKQFTSIGKILTFVDSQNYFGDVYKDNRDLQIKASEFWTKLFLMSDKDYKKNKTEIQELFDKNNKDNLKIDNLPLNNLYCIKDYKNLSF